jgi:hypothetical protein
MRGAGETTAPDADFEGWHSGDTTPDEDPDSDLPDQVLAGAQGYACDNLRP